MLVLGQLGSGKSTLVALWASRVFDALRLTAWDPAVVDPRTVGLAPGMTEDGRTSPGPSTPTTVVPVPARRAREFVELNINRDGAAVEDSPRSALGASPGRAAPAVGGRPRGGLRGENAGSSRRIRADSVSKKSSACVRAPRAAIALRAAFARAPRVANGCRVSRSPLRVSISPGACRVTRALVRAPVQVHGWRAAAAAGAERVPGYLRWAYIYGCALASVARLALAGERRALVFIAHIGECGFGGTPEEVMSLIAVSIAKYCRPAASLCAALRECISASAPEKQLKLSFGRMLAGAATFVRLVIVLDGFDRLEPRDGKCVPRRGAACAAGGDRALQCHGRATEPILVARGRDAAERAAHPHHGGEVRGARRGGGARVDGALLVRMRGAPCVTARFRQTELRVPPAASAAALAVALTRDGGGAGWCEGHGLLFRSALDTRVAPVCAWQWSVLRVLVWWSVLRVAVLVLVRGRGGGAPGDIICAGIRDGACCY